MIKILLICVAAAIVAEAFEFVPVIESRPGVRGARKGFRLGHGNDDIQVSRNRNAIKGKEMLWPGGVIPYTYATKYPADMTAIINGAMKAIQDNTCIKFVAQSKEPNYITFAAHPSGTQCSSAVGTTNRGQQVVYLSDSKQGTCLTHAIVVHELMHAIGLDHEHNRADRDQFVKVDMGKVDPDMKHNFDKSDEFDFFHYGCPYTYESVMHYDKTSFGIPNGVTTMTPANQAFANIIGNAEKAHPNDYEKINRIYKCKKVVAGHKCGAQPPMPCADDPAAPCAQIAKAGCDSSPAAQSWKVRCRKTCNTCNN